MVTANVDRQRVNVFHRIRQHDWFPQHIVLIQQRKRRSGCAFAGRVLPPGHLDTVHPTAVGVEDDTSESIRLYSC